MSLVINTDNTLVRDEFLFLLLCTHVIDLTWNLINKRAPVWATNYNKNESIEWNSYAALICFNIVILFKDTGNRIIEL